MRHKPYSTNYLYDESCNPVDPLRDEGTLLDTAIPSRCIMTYHERWDVDQTGNYYMQFVLYKIQ